jgi:DNA-binding CsgD family transcriptional regulator/N-acetylneuraminic acid mutarotase
MAEYGEPLSERELEILQQVATGATNREVAYGLNISPNTVKVHLRNIFAKLGAESRTEATMIAVQEGWVTIPGAAPTPSAEGEPEPAEPVAPAPPLPWQRRVALIAAALLAVAATAVSWPRSPARGSPSDAPLPLLPGSEESLPLSLEEATHWSERAQMPTRRTGLALAAVNHRLVAIGGEGPDGVSGEVEVYDPQSDTWERGTQKPTPTTYAAAGVVDGRIYVPGGCTADGRATAQVEVYDVATAQWTEVTPLPTPLCAYALAVHEGRIYVFGGTDQERVLRTTFVYDPQSDRWDERALMPEARTVAAAAPLDERIYVVGGYRDGQDLNTCSVYHPTDDTWTACAPLTVGRSGMGLVSLAGQLYAIGGGEYLGFNERYEPRTDRWTAVNTPLTGVWQSPGVAVLDMTVYAVGGWSDDYVGLNLTFDPLPIRIFLPVTEG